MENEKHSASRFGAVLAAGAAMGLAAGLFLQSKKGKQVTKDAQKKAAALQKKVMRKLEGIEEMSKEKYQEVVDDVLAYYEKTKEVAKAELPEVRTYMLRRWKEIESRLKD